MNKKKKIQTVQKQTKIFHFYNTKIKTERKISILILYYTLKRILKKHVIILFFSSSSSSIRYERKTYK